MKKSKRVIRHGILHCLYAHLQDAYGLEIQIEQLNQDQLSDRDIDALLAFKSDARIDELRNALDRLERGVYGTCLACKNPVDQTLLDVDPARRLCGSCDVLYSHIMTHGTGMSIHSQL